MVWILFSVASAFQPPSSDPWPAKALPLEVEVPSDACPLGGACVEAVRQAAEHWATVPCLGLSATVVAGTEVGELGDGVNQVLFSDPAGVVAAFNTNNPNAIQPAIVVDSGIEADFHLIDGFPLATHEDVRNNECYQQIDLLSVATYALGRMFRLTPPSPNGPPLPFRFWAFEECSPDSGIIDPPPAGVFDFSPGIEIDCEPFGITEGFVIETVPLELDCVVVPASGRDGLFVPYDEYLWDWGDGTMSTGPSGAHTYEEGGVHQIRVVGLLDGVDCSPLRGGISAALTLCNNVAADLTTDPPRGRTIHVRNHATAGPPGCDVSADWLVFEGPEPTGTPILESTSWSPFLELPRPGVYTAQVTLVGLNEVTVVETITFEVGEGCGCATGPGSLGWLALLPLALVRRRAR